MADWQSLRGKPDAYPALLDSMRALVERDGVDATLRTLLPDLLPGVAAAAFHGLIRTAHAVQSGHADEVAAALAYWAWRWLPRRCLQRACRCRLGQRHWCVMRRRGALRVL